MIFLCKPSNEILRLSKDHLGGLLQHPAPLQPQLLEALLAEGGHELGLVLGHEQAVVGSLEAGEDQPVDEAPALLPEAVEHVVHLLQRDQLAHQAQQPPVQHDLDVDADLQDVGVQVAQFALDELLDALAVALQVLQLPNVDHPQLLVLHELHQRPEGLLRVLDVVQQNRSDVVQPLHVAQLQVVYAVGQQHLAQHLPEDAATVEGRARDVGAVQVFVDLGDVAL